MNSMKLKDMSMYKKSMLISALFCIATQYASEVTPLRPWLELKPSYFFFYDSPMKNIYKKGGLEMQLSASVPVYNFLDVYGSIGCRHVSGHALHTGEKTSLTLMPIDIGLKPVFQCAEKFYYFFAVGPRFFYFQQNNNSPYVDCKIKTGGVGLFLNTGFNIPFSDCFLFGLFGEYSYEKKKVHPKKLHVFSNGALQVGGFAFGVSFGYVF
jgi:hypothetical protein